MLIIFDENFPCNIAEGINIIENSNRDTILKCTVTHPYLLDMGGTLDDSWIEYAGSNNAIIMTFDKDFKDIKKKKHLYIEHNIGVFFFKYDKKEKMYWQTVRLFIDNFEKIKETILENPPPFVYEVSKKGVSRFEF